MMNTDNILQFFEYRQRNNVHHMIVPHLHIDGCFCFLLFILFYYRIFMNWFGPGSSAKSEQEFWINKSANTSYCCPLHAVDLCFKILHVLNAKYPAECSMVWIFIQRVIYKIRSNNDEHYNSVNALISTLNKYENECT